MNRSLKIILLLLAAGMMVIQFFRPERNLGEQGGDGDLLVVQEVPGEIAGLLEESCYDCHSNHTHYPWYSRIAPFSWYLEAHIRGGKEEANFSAYGEMNTLARIALLSEICEVVESGSMPLASYTLIHREARMDEAEKEALCLWSESETIGLLKRSKDSGPSSN